MLAPALANEGPNPNAHNPSMLDDFNFNQPEFLHKLPFAEYQIVIQVSEDNPKLWNLALNNAENIQKYFGSDKTRIVVVTYGPGLKMLLAKSSVAKRVKSLNASGVEFDACHNTMKHMAKKLKHLPKLVPQAVIVPSGVVRITQLEHAGFNYLKP
jgi:intracellular sulfur oxidation DsrE/DsrF family protein